MSSINHSSDKIIEIEEVSNSKDEESKVDGLICFTGGGSAGHVTPNLALIETWCNQGGTAMYVGRRKSVEAELLRDYPEVSFHPIPSERLRRYFHWGNFIMPFIVLRGIFKAFWILRRHQPIALFSKGGFVALPPVIAAWLNRIPVLVHESDGSLGLANKLSLPFAKVVCLAQERAKKNVNHKDIQLTGSPLRQAFFSANPDKAISLFSLKHDRPLLLVFGGSLGAKKINDSLWQALPKLIDTYEIIHVVGQGHINEQQKMNYSARGYQQIEYIKDGFADLLSCAHLILCRSGANTIAELIALQKPALLVPLSTLSSRGDQAINADEFIKLGGGVTIDNESLSGETLETGLNHLEKNYEDHKRSLAQIPYGNGTKILLNLIVQNQRRSKTHQNIQKT